MHAMCPKGFRRTGYVRESGLHGYEEDRGAAAPERVGPAPLVRIHRLTAFSSELPPPINNAALMYCLDVTAQRHCAKEHPDAVATHPE